METNIFNNILLILILLLLCLSVDHDINLIATFSIVLLETSSPDYRLVSVTSLSNDLKISYDGHCIFSFNLCISNQMIIIMIIATIVIFSSSPLTYLHSCVDESWRGLRGHYRRRGGQWCCVLAPLSSSCLRCCVFLIVAS